MISRRRILLGTAGLSSAAIAAGFGWQWTKANGPVPHFADMAYAKASPRQVFDVYLPEGAGPSPVLIDIHGGAFKLGDKAGKPVSAALLARGIAIVRPNYRFSDTTRWPGQLQDMLDLVATLKSNAGSFTIDPERLALWGQSAGAFIAVSTALSLIEAGTPPKAVVDYFGPMDFATMDADKAAAGTLTGKGRTDPADSAESSLLGYAVASDRDGATKAGPIGRLKAMPSGTRLPPLMIRHGGADPLIAPRQSERLRQAWQMLDPASEIDLVVLKGAGHGGPAFDTAPVTTDLEAFLVRHLLA